MRRAIAGVLVALAAAGAYAGGRWQGLAEGRGAGCDAGIRLENERVHEGWCRALSVHDPSNRTGLRGGCGERFAGIVPEGVRTRCLTTDVQ